MFRYIYGNAFNTALEQRDVFVVGWIGHNN